MTSNTPAGALGLWPLSADPDDEYLVDLARAAAVDLPVAGDAHLLDLSDRLPVMTPAQFLTSLGG
jgi:predicted nucleic acid-binding protein